jgi:hypothetical protein
LADFELSSSLDQLQATSVNYRIALGSDAGRKALTPNISNSFSRWVILA